MARWPTSIEFVNLAVDRIGEGSETKLANELKLGANGYQKVYRWQQGAKLNYEETMKILDKLGWLSMGEATSAERDPAAPDDPLAALATTGAALLRGQEAILAALGVDRGVLEEQAETGGQPQAGSKGKPR